jgi:hypothetical protein
MIWPEPARLPYINNPKTYLEPLPTVLLLHSVTRHWEV